MGWRSWWPVPAFAPFSFFVLWLDSPSSGMEAAPGQLAADLVALLYFALLLMSLSDALRWPVALMVPVTAAGEWLLCVRLNLYTYRSVRVPFYVPFGHAILLGTAMLLSRLAWTTARSRAIEGVLVPSFGGIIVAAVLSLGDGLSLGGGLFFGMALVRKATRLLYLAVGLLVLFVEFAGTWLDCWSWNPRPFGWLRAANPPVGAVCFYVVADIVTMRAARFGAAIRALATSRLSPCGAADSPGGESL